MKKQAWSGRKYRSAWFLTGLFTVLLVVPAVVSLILTLCSDDKVYEFTIMSIEWYGPIITLIWGAYFGANVAEKHKSFSENGKTMSVSLLGEIDDEGNDSGGQPEESLGNEP